MLGARVAVANEVRGSHVAAEPSVVRTLREYEALICEGRRARTFNQRIKS